MFDLLQTIKGVKTCSVLDSFLPEDEVLTRSYELTKDQFCLDLMIKNFPFTSNLLLGYLNCLVRERESV